MKKAIARKKGISGFTLLEVIVSLTVAAILGALLVSVVGTAVTGSAKLPYRLVQVYDMNQVMDNITADYISMLPQTNDVLSVLKTRIDAKTGGYGNYTSSTSWIKYTGTTPAETSGVAADGVLKVVISPPSGGSGVTHSALFTR
jgi:prepilin-type N-terminal cleavage/methylation domain-containing protein